MLQRYEKVGMDTQYVTEIAFVETGEWQSLVEKEGQDGQDG